MSEIASIPTQNGQLTYYVNSEAQQTRWFNPTRKVIFINGMMNSGIDHRDSALALSLLQMCPVHGVFNQSGGFFKDLGQCIADKYQFDGPIARSPSEALDRAEEKQKKALGPKRTRAQLMEDVLARNPAALAVFRLLRRSEMRNAPVFAHSQGNLILANVLSAILAVDGSSGLSGRIVYTFGSPTVNWPAGFKPIECGFTFDPITWLAGFDTSFSISKLGMPNGAINPITHGFLEYLKHDPAFVVNRFRWGSLGVTASMDEEGLAEAMVAMDTNIPRVQAILEHLDKKHNSDADDVALLYVQKLQKAGNKTQIAHAIRSTPAFRQLLTRVMDEGWTSSEEKSAIAFINSL